MKKFCSIILVFITLSLVVGCTQKNEDNEDLLYLGLNCEINDLDLDKKIIVISGLDKMAIEQIGSMVKFDCRNSDIIKFENDEPIFISLEDLEKGNHIAINIYKSEVNKISENDLPKIKSIQLSN